MHIDYSSLLILINYWLAVKVGTNYLRLFLLWNSAHRWCVEVFSALLCYIFDLKLAVDRLDNYVICLLK